MTDWNGFSNTEIQTLKHANINQLKATKGLNPKFDKSINKEVKRKNNLNEKKNAKLPISSDSKDETPISSENHNASNCHENNSEVVKDPPPATNGSLEEEKINPELDGTKNGESVPKVCFESMEDFEKYNKEIKEENVEKKKILLKAIFDRAQKTKEEQRRLALLKKELEDVDKNVSVDISALRDSIEEQSLAYMKAQQRFEKAEKEYITAKSEFNLLSEKKQGLTEKLLLTIQQTEIKKAKKLTELLQTLQISEDSAHQIHTPTSDKTAQILTPPA